VLCHDSDPQTLFSVIARVNAGSHGFIGHGVVQYRWNEPSCLYFPPAERHRTLAGTRFISRPAEGRRLSWPWWLVAYRLGLFDRPSARRSPISK